MRRGAWVVMLAGLLMALPGAAEDSPLPSVDLGVRELELWRLSVVSRRTDDDWWALSPEWSDTQVKAPRGPVRVFRSADAGRSWREAAEQTIAMAHALNAQREPGSVQDSGGNIDFLVWYTPEVGLMAGYIGARVVRTTDGGRTWSRVELPLPDELWVYDLERAGGRTWLCGSSGNIYRSDDAGATWEAMKGTPFNAEDRCMDMSFLDPERGQAVGMRGSLWATEDGGTTWRRLEAPAQPPRKLSESLSLPADLRHIALLTPEVTWVQGEGGRFQTTDGGKTWHPTPTTPGEDEAALRIARLPDGRSIITRGASGDSAPSNAWVPSFEKSAAVMGDDTVVRFGGKLMSTFLSGRLVKTGPLTTAGSGVLTPLEGLGPRQSGPWFGWKGDQVVVSHDQGLSWLSVGRVPEQPLRTLTLTKDGRLFALTGTGALLDSPDVGRTWTRSAGWLDGYDFAVANGAPPEGLESPLHCLLTAPEAVVKVRFDSVGCHGGTESRLEMNLSKSRAVLSGKYGGGEKPVEVRSRKLTRDDGQRILRTLVDAATRQEVPLGCTSTTRYETVIEWSCSPKESWRRKVAFEASECEPFTEVGLVGGATPAGVADSKKGYARSLGVHEAAARALEDASR
ncbi:WD40/YVTN/BNR-like repeat-containing protein [Pyxidicoccus sp. 3LG]